MVRLGRPVVLELALSVAANSAHTTNDNAHESTSDDRLGNVSHDFSVADID
jgi:hypothetical protein